MFSISVPYTCPMCSYEMVFHPIGLAEADSRRGIFLDALELLDTDPFRKEDEIRGEIGFMIQMVLSMMVPLSIIYNIQMAVYH